MRGQLHSWEANARLIETSRKAGPNLGHRLPPSLTQWTQPAPVMLADSPLAAVSRRWADLILENGLWRQQLIGLTRQVKQPHLAQADRLQWVLLAGWTRFW